MSAPFEKLNPVTNMGEAEYTALWQKLFATVLNGFWGHVLFFLMLFLAFWVGVRQRNPALAALFLFVAAAVAYGGGVLKFIGVTG